jgi:hypothetical protein
VMNLWVLAPRSYKRSMAKSCRGSIMCVLQWIGVTLFELNLIFASFRMLAPSLSSGYRLSEHWHVLLLLSAAEVAAESTCWLTASSNRKNMSKYNSTSLVTT